MKVFILILCFPLISFAKDLPISPYPVFLKESFSSVLEFDAKPTQVVLGDSQSFQLEKLKNSIVIKPTEPYATTNMFVYFRKQKTLLFLLTASEDAEPTFHRFFKTEAKKVFLKLKKKTSKNIRSAAVLKASFDKNKDHLVLEVALRADAKRRISPKWKLIRIRYKGSTIKAHKLWSERGIVQKDARILARLTFKKPNIPKNLKGVKLIIPTKEAKGFSLPLARGRRLRGNR